ncbi:hypothetical protein [Streptomyces sp. NPDC127595]
MIWLGSDGLRVRQWLGPDDSASGNGGESQALFGYDGKALPAMSWFSRR